MKFAKLLSIALLLASQVSAAPLSPQPLFGTTTPYTAISSPTQYTFVGFTVSVVNGQPVVQTATMQLTIDSSPGPMPVPPGPGPIPIPPVPVPPVPVPPVPIPPIPVPPTPIPPTPVLPDGRFKLAAFTYTQFKLLPPALQVVASTFAANFDATAAAATAGTLGTQSDMQSDVAARNIATEGLNQAGYRGLSTAMGAQLQALAAAGAITTTKDLIDAFHEIAIGLRAVQP